MKGSVLRLRSRDEDRSLVGVDLDLIRFHHQLFEYNQFDPPCAHHVISECTAWAGSYETSKKPYR